MRRYASIVDFASPRTAASSLNVSAAFAHMRDALVNAVFALNNVSESDASDEARIVIESPVPADYSIAEANAPARSIS